MKDLGPLAYVFRLEVHQFAKYIVLNQHKYTLDLIELVGLHTTVKVNVKLYQNDGEPLRDPTLYRRLVSSLVYSMITRPNILFATNLKVNS